jgi:hypothetical protein
MWQSTNADRRTSEMIIDPDDQNKLVEVIGLEFEAVEWKTTEEHGYPFTNGQRPLSEHVAGWWYRRPPMVSKVLLILLRVAHLSTGSTTTRMMLSIFFPTGI